jgi:gamma-glutamyltranspeptidase/glutathione hydrolase
MTEQPARGAAAVRASEARGGRGAAATGHPLATAAALGVLHAGGNAVDAAVAAQAACCVAMPHACGLGGDALLLVHDGTGATAVTGSGRSAAAAGDRPATTGGASVTVPGAVQAWVDALERWGSRDLAACLAAAIALAEDGVPVTTSLASAVCAQRGRLLAGGAGTWPLLSLGRGEFWRQPELAALLRAVADGGRSAFYEGALAEAVCAAARRDGGLLSRDDLATHAGLVTPPVTVGWDGGTVSVQPPPSQGVLLAMVLQWMEREAAAGRSLPTAGLEHLAVEVTEAAFAWRDHCATRGGRLLDQHLEVDRDLASRRGGPRAYLHTTGVAVADGDGLAVSSLVSVFDDFGAATFVPEGGFVLNNRAGGFTAAPNQPGPGRRPVHTLAPALHVRDGEVTALATPGADGQVQTLLQVLLGTRLGSSLADAVTAPRWRSEGARVLVGSGHAAAADLTARGHEVVTVDDADDRFGAVVTAGTGPSGCSAVGDWRREVAVGALP